MNFVADLRLWQSDALAAWEGNGRRGIIAAATGTGKEAMASGIPVVHSEATGLVECVGGAGILCMRNDLDAWEHAIRKLLTDKAYRELIRKYGFNRVRDLDIEQRRGYQELAMKIEKIED